MPWAKAKKINNQIHAFSLGWESAFAIPRGLSFFSVHEDRKYD